MNNVDKKSALAVSELRSRGFKWDGDAWNSKNTSFHSSLGYHHAAVDSLEIFGFTFDGVDWVEPEFLPEDFKKSNFGLYCAIAAIAFIFVIIGLCVGGLK